MKGKEKIKGNIKKKKKRKEKKKEIRKVKLKEGKREFLGQTGSEGEKGREKKGVERETYLLLKIYGDRVVDSIQSKKQSSSTRQELRVSTKIFELRQTS